MKYRVVIEQDAEGFFVIEAPDLPGCVTQGKSREEALRNIKDAIRAFHTHRYANNSPWSSSIEETVIDIDV